MDTIDSIDGKCDADDVVLPPANGDDMLEVSTKTSSPEHLSIDPMENTQEDRLPNNLENSPLNHHPDEPPQNHLEDPPINHPDDPPINHDPDDRTDIHPDDPPYNHHDDPPDYHPDNPPEHHPDDLPESHPDDPPEHPDDPPESHHDDPPANFDDLPQKQHFSHHQLVPESENHLPSLLESPQVNGNRQQNCSDTSFSGTSTMSTDDDDGSASSSSDSNSSDAEDNLLLSYRIDDEMREEEVDVDVDSDLNRDVDSDLNRDVDSELNRDVSEAFDVAPNRIGGSSVTEEYPGDNDDNDYADEDHSDDEELDRSINDDMLQEQPSSQIDSSRLKNNCEDEFPINNEEDIVGMAVPKQNLFQHNTDLTANVVISETTSDKANEINDIVPETSHSMDDSSKSSPQNQEYLKTHVDSICASETQPSDESRDATTYAINDEQISKDDGVHINEACEATTNQEDLDLATAIIQPEPPDSESSIWTTRNGSSDKYHLSNETTHFDNGPHSEDETEEDTNQIHNNASRESSNDMEIDESVNSHNEISNNELHSLEQQQPTIQTTSLENYVSDEDMFLTDNKPTRRDSITNEEEEEEEEETDVYNEDNGKNCENSIVSTQPTMNIRSASVDHQEISEDVYNEDMVLRNNVNHLGFINEGDTAARCSSMQDLSEDIDQSNEEADVQFVMDEYQNYNRNQQSQVEDMDLEETNDVQYQNDIQDETTISAPQSPQKSPMNVSTTTTTTTSGFIPNSTTQDSSLLSNRHEVSNDTIEHKRESHPPPTSKLAVATVTTNEPPPPAINNESISDLLMHPPAFKNTDEMKYYLKHHLQYSDLGKFFHNVDVSTVMSDLASSQNHNSSSLYLGLQPSLKFRCFKCSESNYSSLAELKEHQAKCLKIPIAENVDNNNPSSPRGLRSSLNSDNAMDVDLTENTTTSKHNEASRALSASCVAIDSKIRITRKVYLCSACGTYYENWNLFYHMREVHHKFICLLCLGIFPSAELLVPHLEGRHNSKPDVYEHKDHLLATLKDACYVMCTVCEHIFSEFDDFTNHSCENYIKACGICGLKFIHKQNCQAAASSKAIARQRREKNKNCKQRTTNKLEPSNTAPEVATTTNAAAAASDGGAAEPSGLNFSNTLFGGSSSSINGILGGHFELPQSILSNQTPDGPGDSYTVPSLNPEPPLAYLPQRLLQDERPPEYPTNSSSSSVSSGSYIKPTTTTTNNPPRSTGKSWLSMNNNNNGYIDPPHKPQTNSQINHHNKHNNADSSNSQVALLTSNIMSSGKNISINDHQDRISIGEDFMDNRDIDIIDTYCNDFDTFNQDGTCKNISLTDFDTIQQPNKATINNHQNQPSSPAIEEPRLLVPKLKLNLSKAYQTPIESEESSTESDEEEEEEAEEEEEEDDEDDVDAAKQSKENEQFKLALNMLQTPSNASRTPHAMTPHSFAAPSSIPPTTPPHLQQQSIAGSSSDNHVDVEQISDMAIEDDNHDDDEEEEEEETSTIPSSQHTENYNFTTNHVNNNNNINNNDPESEDVNIEDEDKESTIVEENKIVLPAEPFDGIIIADEDTTLPTELLLSEPIDRIPMINLIRICLKATYPYCLYCNHARKIVVQGRHLALHMLAQHRFKASVDSITAEELLPTTIIQHIKANLDDLSNVYFNLDTFNTAEPDGNVISPKSFECFQCRFQARHHKDLYLHNRKMHLKTIVVCLMCKANFYSYSELSGHICPGYPNREGHLDVNFRCVLCNLDRIPSAFRLMVHLRKKHGACDICLEHCDDQSRLSSHVCKHKLHHLCYRCGISYRNKADITKHLFWKHGTESQLCKKCLQKKWPHVYHFCVPPSTFQCEICSITFRRAVALKVHKRLHSDDHPYPCTEDGCEKKFISRKLLLKHVARHFAPIEPEPIIINANSAIISEDKTPPEDQDNHKSATQLVDTQKEKTELVEKPPAAAAKPLLDIIKDLPAPNLSESDSSDESDSEQQRTKPISKSPDLNTTAAAPIVPDDDEQQTPVPIAGIWDNFKSYQANQKQSFVDEDREHDPPPPSLLHVSQSDHDYCNMYKNNQNMPKKVVELIPFVEIKQEPLDEDELAAAAAAQQQTSVAIKANNKNAETKLLNNKSPKKGRSPKKALDKSGSDSSSSDSDSSCSCGSNCSCTSGSSSDGSTSSTSSSSGDSSSSEGRRKKAAAKLAKRPQSTAEVDVAVAVKDEVCEQIDVGTEERTKNTPSKDPDLIILESDLETEESETDEEFYDEHPLRMNDQLFAEKRRQLMLQTSMNPINQFVENSRPSTPSLPPAEEELRSRKQKAKKRKKDRKNAKCVPSLKLNLSTQSVTIIEEPHHQQQPQPVYNSIVPQASSAAVVAAAAPPLLQPYSGFPPISSNNHFPPSHINNKPRLSTGSSCSDVDNSLKRSKRRRIPNKFYGYTSDEDTPTGTTTTTNPLDAFKPQPPPNLTWNKEDLPQTPTVVRTPPIKTIIKFPTAHNTFTRTSSSSLDYHPTTNDPNTTYRTASPQLDVPPPPAIPSRQSQPPIPPIIIRPNRVIQPPLVEPLRVPAVPVHHIVPPSNPENDAESDSSDSDSSNEGHLQIQQTPTPPVHTPHQPFQRLVTTPLRTPSNLAKTPKPRNSTGRKRPASKFLTTPKAKRRNDNLPKTPAIPAQYLPFLDPPEPVVHHHHQPRSMTTHIPISAVANQIRYPIMPPAGSRPARPGESVYCYCRCPYDEVSEMIACDGNDCPIEWFHFECVNIMVPPKGTWYCPQCRPKYPINDDDDDPVPM